MDELESSVLGFFFFNKVREWIMTCYETCKIVNGGHLKKGHSKFAGPPSTDEDSFA